MAFGGANAWFWDPKINTPLGTVEGYTKDNVNVFHSIPFAQPPVGNLRFASPVPIKPWQGTLDVKSLPNICPQLDLVGGLHLGNEDCLYLHVYVPKSADTSKPLPVLFWLFGGGFVMGDGVEFGWYSGVDYAERHNVIVVAPNYRVAAFGFLAHPALQAEDPEGSTGNYGIQDQRLAMEWVQENIASFGGDPERVTLFGQSAGAMSVCHHYANAQSRPLFHAAIMQSGTCDADQFFQRLPRAVQWSTTFMAACGCNQTQHTTFLKCIRSKPVDELMNAIASWFKPTWPLKSLFTEMNQTYGLSMEALAAGIALPPFSPVMPWGPAIDGTAKGLRDTPLTLMRKGLNTQVPLIVGSNTDEGAIFAPAFPLILRNLSHPISEDDAASMLRVALAYSGTPYDVSPILDAYPPSLYGGDQSKRLQAMITDFVFKCSARRAVRAVSQQGLAAYLYQFTYLNTWLDIQLLGDYHTAELSFVFDNQWPPLLHDFKAKDQVMSDSFEVMWRSFARSGDPNDSSLTDDDCTWDSRHPMCAPLERCSYQFRLGDLTLTQSCRLRKAYTKWPKYNTSIDQNLIMTVPLAVNTGLATHTCDVWDQFLGL